MPLKNRNAPMCFSPAKEEDYKVKRCVTCHIKFKTIMNAARCKECTIKYGFQFDDKEEDLY